MSGLRDILLPTTEIGPEDVYWYRKEVPEVGRLIHHLCLLCCMRKWRHVWSEEKCVTSPVWVPRNLH